MDEGIETGVVDVCVDMQQRAKDMAGRYQSEMGRHSYVTPTSYLELINCFKVTIHVAPISLFAGPKHLAWLIDLVVTQSDCRMQDYVACGLILAPAVSLPCDRLELDRRPFVMGYARQMRSPAI